MSTVTDSRQTGIVPTIEPEAATFADEHGLWQEIKLAVDLIHESFPGLTAIRVEHVFDPESEDYECLRVQSTVSGELEEILDCEDAFGSAMRACMDVERRCLFAFTVIII